MSRILLQYLLPLVLPTVVWLIWWVTVGRHRSVAGGAARELEKGPWFWLILAGVGLLGLSLVYTALTSGYDPKGKYVPPHWEDGRIVPGRIE